MSNHPASGLPDYFALFQSMFTPASPSANTPAPNMFAMLDPKELEKKIGELETVLNWLKATSGVIEMSLQTMKYQQSLLESLASQQESAGAEPAAPPNMEELARMAEAMNPAMWALNLMQQPVAPKASTKKAVKTSAKAPAKKPANKSVAPRAQQKKVKR